MYIIDTNSATLAFGSFFAIGYFRSSHISIPGALRMSTWGMDSGAEFLVLQMPLNSVNDRYKMPKKKKLQVSS